MTTKRKDNKTNIITSGLHLNEPNIGALQRMKVSRIQIINLHN